VVVAFDGRQHAIGVDAHFLDRAGLVERHGDEVRTAPRFDRITWKASGITMRALSTKRMRGLAFECSAAARRVSCPRIATDP